MSRRSGVLAVALVVAAALFVLAGCSSSGTSLENTKWKLVSWSLSSIDPATVTITAEFADGQMSGNSGVNTYSGPYKAGPGDTFQAGPLSSTLMAGEESAMQAEAGYQALLGQAASFKVADGKLTLFNGDRQESLIYESAGK
jgi:heat shock protein HslJ